MFIILTTTRYVAIFIIKFQQANRTTHNRADVSTHLKASNQTRREILIVGHLTNMTSAFPLRQGIFQESLVAGSTDEKLMLTLARASQRTTRSVNSSLPVLCEDVIGRTKKVGGFHSLHGCITL